MTNQNPDPVQLCTKLVQLHQASESPTGKFGFHFNTCQGNLPQQTAWNASWVDFYIQLVRGAMQLNKERNGKWKNLEQVVDRLITHVVPQVLGPLEAEGRTVKPTLIHGDLWDGNMIEAITNSRRNRSSAIDSRARLLKGLPEASSRLPEVHLAPSH